MSPKGCRTVVVEMDLEMTQLTHFTKTATRHTHFSIKFMMVSNVN